MMKAFTLPKGTLLHYGGIPVYAALDATLLTETDPALNQTGSFLMSESKATGAGMEPELRTYEGFPEGVTDEFCAHAAVATSQYNTTARALAAEVLALRAGLHAVEGGWRCFHCDEVFTDRAEAFEHFGFDEGKTPACRLSSADVTMLRQLEADNRDLRHENEKLDNDSQLWHEAEADRVRRIGDSQWWQEIDYREGEKIVLTERAEAAEARLAEAAAFIRREMLISAVLREKQVADLLASLDAHETRHEEDL